MSPVQERVKKRVAENRRVLQRARQAEKRIQRSVSNSEKRSRHIEENLRRDGLLRDSD